MKESLRQKILTTYPEWHKNPLRLTTDEIAEPKLVIASFFDCYNLPGIRACLKQWLEDSLNSIEGNSRDNLFTYYDVERLIEAIFVIYNQKKNNKKKNK